jgi:homocysteine S-methyltransferase
MARYRAGLPQLSERLFLTDAGMETYLIFHEGLALPLFASFDLMKNEEGVAQVRRYYERYIALARDHGVGFVLESPTWRANPEWAAKLGYDRDTLAALNRRAIALMAQLRAQHETARTPIVISGNIGPRGDGYSPDRMMRASEASDYHADQIDAFRDTEADLVSAFTLNYVEEAIGIVRAAVTAAMPVVISFTVETDGKLPTGQSLRDAVLETDAATGRAPAYYMLNCAHPTHFADVLTQDEAWVQRLRGLRANASTRSHAELDAAPDLDAGDPVALGQQYHALRRRLPQFTILGGCCGTDHRHVEQFCFACVSGEEREVA